MPNKTYNYIQDIPISITVECLNKKTSKNRIIKKWGVAITYDNKNRGIYKRPSPKPNIFNTEAEAKMRAIEYGEIIGRKPRFLDLDKKQK